MNACGGVVRTLMQMLPLPREALYAQVSSSEIDTAGGGGGGGVTPGTRFTRPVLSTNTLTETFLSVLPHFVTTVKASVRPKSLFSWSRESILISKRPTFDVAHLVAQTNVTDLRLSLRPLCCSGMEPAKTFGGLNRSSPAQPPLPFVQVSVQV